MAVTLGLVIAPAAGLAAVLLLVDDEPTGLVPPVEPVWTEATRQEVTDRREVVVTVETAEPPLLVSPGGEGTVTRLAIGMGDVISDGTPIYSLDGSARVAMGAEEPLFRSVTWSSIGAEVAGLEAFLSRRGHFDHQPDDHYDTDTYRAIRHFEEAIGVAPTGLFDPSYVVWLPFETMAVEEVDVLVGAPLPARGQPIVGGVASVISAHLTTPDGRPLDGLARAPYTLEVGGLDLGSFTPPSDLGESVVQALLTLPQEILQSSSEETEPASRRAPGFVQLTDPQSSWVVPASAVTTSAEGQACIWARGDGAIRPQAVELEASTLGQASVAAPGIDSLEILVNPVEFLDEPLCPST